MYKEITVDNYEETIKEGVVLIDFWASWCGPCRMIAPIIDELADEYKNKAVIAKCNVDDVQEIAIRLGVRAIPTLMFFKNGEIAETKTGALSKSAIEDILRKHITF